MLYLQKPYRATPDKPLLFLAPESGAAKPPRFLERDCLWGVPRELTRQVGGNIPIPPPVVDPDMGLAWDFQNVAGNQPGAGVILSKPIVSAYPFTMFAWTRKGMTTPGADMSPFTINSASGVELASIGWTYGEPNCQQWSAGFSQGSAGSPGTVNDWTYADWGLMVGRFNGPASRELFWNGQLIGANTTSMTWFTAAINQVNFNQHDDGDYWSNQCGYFASAGVYARGLTDAEISSAYCDRRWLPIADNPIWAPTAKLFYFPAAAGTTVDIAALIADGAVYNPALLESVDVSAIDSGAVYTPTISEAVTVEPAFISDGSTFTPTLSERVDVGALIDAGATYSPGIGVAVSVNAALVSDGNVYTPTISELISIGALVDSGEVYAPASITEAGEIAAAFIADGAVYSPTIGVAVTVDVARISDGNVYTPTLSESVDVGTIDSGESYGVGLSESLAPAFIGDGAVYTPTAGDLFPVVAIAEGAVYTPTLSESVALSRIDDGNLYSPNSVSSFAIVAALSPSAFTATIPERVPTATIPHLVPTARIPRHDR